jgi:tripartite-type tricarboxylate transporter receptor subunit TctC
MTPVEEEQATPAALERLLKTEIEKWDGIIKNAGITPQ